MADNVCHKCNMPSNSHSFYCPTNNEYDLYPCLTCGKYVIQFSMAMGQCQECRKNSYGNVNLWDGFVSFMEVK